MGNEEEQVESNIGTKFTDEELDFLLDRLNKMEESIQYMSEDEKALRNFLLNYLNGLNSESENENTKLNDVINKDSKYNGEEFDFECKKRRNSNLLSLLEQKVGEFIIINIISGESCCQIKGVLCDIGEDMINMIDDKEMTFVRLDAIVAIKNKLKKTDCDADYCYEKDFGEDDYCDEYYEEDFCEDDCICEEEVFSKDDRKEKKGSLDSFEEDDSTKHDDLQVNKREATYIEMDEEN
ncbi:hypothetical protein [Sporohalobacter salinus]|uniref:hypothetical protein n=1 Tax=Sporohalobacter salinus TaxID=1494606 RepID=UPI00195FFB15|nr:hypothetical protein [Sporohalobacter salinus]MBM7624223.1 hypothetical protein [Sporohalobacter salinus]